jgi:hypothetical protein
LRAAPVTQTSPYRSGTIRKPPELCFMFPIALGLF